LRSNFLFVFDKELIGQRKPDVPEASRKMSSLFFNEELIGKRKAEAPEASGAIFLLLEIRK